MAVRAMGGMKVAKVAVAMVAAAMVAVRGGGETAAAAANQDQELDRVDFEFLNNRLKQTSLQEKLANQWLDHLLAKENILRA